MRWFLSAILMVACVNVHAGPRLDQAIGNATQDFEGTLTAILLDVRTIVEKKLGGQDGIRVASEIVKAARAAMSDKSYEDLEQVKANSEDAVKRMRSSAFKHDDYVRMLKENRKSIGDRDTRFLSNLASPNITCKKVGAAGSMAILLIIGPTGKADVSYCTSSSGRRWVEISAGVGLGVVFGAVGSANIGKRETLSARPRRIVSLSTFDQAQVAYFVGVQEESMGPDGEMSGLWASPDLPGMDDIRGISCGAVFSATRGVQLNLKVLPLGTNKVALLTAFK